MQKELKKSNNPPTPHSYQQMLGITYIYIYIYIYRSEGEARTGYGIPAHDGVGSGGGGEFFRRRRRRRRRPPPGF